jgi:putative CocE/NonD family hydrolase
MLAPTASLEARMDRPVGRRRFLERLGLGLAAVPLARSLAAAEQAGAASLPRYGVKEQRTEIKMEDGVAIAVTLYLPVGAPAGTRFPAILEVLPYRKDDDFALSGLTLYSFFAARGYLGCRVDVRGTGASAGVPEDEYTAREHRDTLRIIDWLSRHPACSGKVGMWGVSYGGFNCIQVAMLRPPALEAIVPIYATDDRYTDDVHYCGGCLHAFENVWAVSMEAENAFPPYPDYAVDDPRTIARFDAKPWSFRWLREQADGPYWRHGSLRPRYQAITAATLMIGGWMDGYTSSVPRMLARMRAPTKAIIGPWPHARPDEEGPWPRIHYLHEVLRWWDRWLKGIDNGVTSEPRLALFVREA